MILYVMKALWERHRRTEAIRKQMHMTRKCSIELDILLGLMGIDYSLIELCPTSVEAEETVNINLVGDDFNDNDANV